ncbi:MAG TPA: tetraacyldisaccharide 4'-kinase [Candidatus Aquabacterium excrementipullorum]|nr:tetraacyldisaccharide 4'-kinase [Candidatus Aquabacterium excrementipullorum]
MSASAWLTRQWLRRGLAARLLWPGHALMQGLIALRRMAYARGWKVSRALPVPVIVVGNRVVGGAGKTPTVLALVRHLRAQGWQPGVLSRGYGRQTSGTQAIILDAGTEEGLDARQVGDECWLIWRHTSAPMGIASRRHDAGQVLLKAHPEIDILVCDDGLQHWPLARQIEIVVFDERGQGNGWLLPAGLLREPINSPPGPGCTEAPLVLYNAAKPSTRQSGHLALKALAPLQRWQDWWDGSPPPSQGPRVPEVLRQAGPAELWAVAGIAQPQRFFKPLRHLGLNFTPCPRPDHDRLDPLPWPETAKHVVLTEKDAVKLSPERLAAQRPGTQVWVAALDFQPEKAFWQELDRRLDHLHAQAGGASVSADVAPA